MARASLPKTTLAAIRRRLREWGASGEAECLFISEGLQDLFPRSEIHGPYFYLPDGTLASGHFWLVLKDGTVVDPTVRQWAAYTGGRFWPGYSDIAVVPPKHPAYVLWSSGAGLPRYTARDVIALARHARMKVDQQGNIHLPGETWRSFVQDECPNSTGEAPRSIFDLEPDALACLAFLIKLRYFQRKGKWL